MKRFDQNAPVPPITIYEPMPNLPPGVQIRRRVPVREPTIGSDVGVPLQLRSRIFVDTVGVRYEESS
jgi:hypothetical protein